MDAVPQFNRAAIPAPVTAPPVTVAGASGPPANPAAPPAAAPPGIVYIPVRTYAGRKEDIDSTNNSGIASALSNRRLLIESQRPFDL